MTVVELDVIHGDHLIKPQSQLMLNTSKVSPISAHILNNHAPFKSIKLKNYFGQLVYELVNKKQTLIVDAKTGHLKEMLSEETIRSLANALYAGTASIQNIELLNSYPQEIAEKKLPVWRVLYDDILGSTLYFHQQSGRLISKRTDLWRTFDFFWILHIMDYLGSDGETGFLFRSFSIVSLLLSIFGAWLLLYRFRKESN